MVAATKYNVFVEHLSGKVHDLFGTAGSTADVVKAVIHTDAPVPTTDAGLTDLTQITGTGYTAGGNSITNVGTRSTTTVTVAASNITWTAGAADWSSTARYVSIYNDTSTSPADPLIQSWDYGATFALGNGETFTADFGGSAFTLA